MKEPKDQGVWVGGVGLQEDGPYGGRGTVKSEKHIFALL